MHAVEVAREFAAALDAEDYEAARMLVDGGCVYHSPSGELVGPEQIIASYRGAGDAAHERFESIEYTSDVVENTQSASETPPTELTRRPRRGQLQFAMIEFIDRMVHRGRTHEYRCRQAVRIDRDGHIMEIRHIELPGQRERLEEFLKSIGF